LLVANVVLVGISTGSLTDSSGVYKIKNIQKGTYIVSVSCIGFMKMDKNGSTIFEMGEKV
jgi:hypothetical protein